MKDIEALILKCIAEKITNGQINDFDELNTKLSPFGLSIKRELQQDTFFSEILKDLELRKESVFTD